MVVKQHIPKTPREQLDHLQEECAELILAIAKIRRFGNVATDPLTGIFYDNVKELRSEMDDVTGAIERVRSWL